MASIAALRPLRVAFIHPDLGIGGAERLVVDAAVGLQKLGHSVTIYTSYWDESRCFAETRDGTLSVTVLGNSIFPRHFKGRFHIVFAILRQLHLAFALLWMTWFGGSSSSSSTNRKKTDDGGSISSSSPAADEGFLPPDIYIVDQLSTCIPILRWLLRTRVIFYCHFPDLLLSPGRSGFSEGVKAPGLSGRKNWLRALYRFPIDSAEEYTTALADRILVNSHFTAKMFQSVFPQIRRQLQIVYPGVHVSALNENAERASKSGEILSNILPPGNQPVILSLNRFEPKKNVALAIQAFAAALKDGTVPSDLRLVIAGGYDTRVRSCTYTLQQLQRTADDLSLSHSTTSRDSQVLFITNLSEEQKFALLTSERTRALLYTPSYEHLGIVPLEAMACGLPVLAIDNGGPAETVLDGVTGYLRSSNRQEWAEAISLMVNMDQSKRDEMARAGRSRVQDYFDVKVMSKGFDRAIRNVLDDAEEGKVPDFWTEPAFLRMMLACIMTVLCGICLVYLVLTRGEEGLSALKRDRSMARAAAAPRRTVRD